MKTFDEKVWDACSMIPKGKISTYKEIGRKLRSKAYRAIGAALSRNPYAPKVPCHRVVRTDGTVGGFDGGFEKTPKKIRLLKKEGLEFKKKDKKEDYKIKNFDMKLFKF